MTHEFSELRRHGPGGREKVVLLREDFAHLHETSAEEVFLCEDVDGWKVADFLLVVESEEILGFDVPVGPEDVPLLRLLGVLNSPAQLLDYRLDDVIMRL